MVAPIETTTSPMLGLIALFPLLGSILAFVIGKAKRDAAGWIATAAAALAFAVTLSLPSHGVLEFRPFTWFSVGGLNVDFTFRFDNLTHVMCLVVTGIGTLIHLYSVAYMAEDESRHRFFSYLNLFMFSMLLLVLGGNLLVMFVGWEGVGLCSYLLIGFWFKNEAYARAGRKAFVVNRIGDAGFLLGIFLLFLHLGSIDFAALSGLITSRPLSEELLVLTALCFFVGACGKSAQIPLFVWLPDAMAGPTPVSALIHAATMVTAGVYMMARMNFLFTLAPLALAIVCVVALATAFVAATTALTQNDIKKVLAYSTVSQLGFMFLAVSAGAYWVALFHVITHAFFKACLFLSAGSVIHGCHHEQDMRHMGGLFKLMPITGVCYAVSTLAIAGIYPFSGYYSKHAILSALEHSHNEYLHPYMPYILAIVTLTACMTAFYMTRSFALTFMGKYHGHAHPHESPWPMVTPLIVLAFFAWCGGFWLHHRLPEYLSSVLPGSEAHGDVSVTENIIHSWPGLLGVALGLVLYCFARGVPTFVYKTAKPLSALFNGKWFFDEIYNALIVRPLEKLSYILWDIFDQGFIDGLVNGTGKVTQVGGAVTGKTQTGQVGNYALFMFIGAVLITVLWLVK